MQTSWKYFWDWLEEYERSLHRSLLEFGTASMNPPGFSKVHANILSKLEVIKLIRNNFRD